MTAERPTAASAQGIRTDATAAHPYRRFVAIGDSFTEGIGDPEPSVPGGNRGWADRVAEVLASTAPDLLYANLAIRGRLLAKILDEQLEPALALEPDLITISAGGNDVIRPGGDPDALAQRLEPAIDRMASTGAQVLLFTGVDVGFSPVFRPLRGKVAIYNEHLRGIAARHGVRIVDQWGLSAIQDARMWSVDRLHPNALGHHEIAREVLRTLEVPNDLRPQRPEPVPPQRWREARREDLSWAREYFGPWIMRRIKGTSTGDGATPKRPTFTP